MICEHLKHQLILNSQLGCSVFIPQSLKFKAIIESFWEFFWFKKHFPVPEAFLFKKLDLPMFLSILANHHFLRTKRCVAIIPQRSRGATKCITFVGRRSKVRKTRHDYRNQKMLCGFSRCAIRPVSLSLFAALFAFCSRARLLFWPAAVWSFASAAPANAKTRARERKSMQERCSTCRPSAPAHSPTGHTYTHFANRQSKGRNAKSKSPIEKNLKRFNFDLV